MISEREKRALGLQKCKDEVVDQESIDRLNKLPSLDEEKRLLALANPHVSKFLYGSNDELVKEFDNLPNITNPGHSDARIK
ncbi:MAG: hypothetical protein ACXABY_13555 [Candidatus Thorarchaeota archaeon]|jgi:hypothetical protein